MQRSIIKQGGRFYTKMCSLNEVKSFVFLDLETTGLPHLENNQTKLTELSMIGVQASHLRLGVVPRVQNKLTLCFNPRKLISYESEKLTGLSNTSLEDLPVFSSETVHQINSFLSHTPQPVCFVAHNGNRFDYPILRTHISKTNVPLLDVFCIDSLTAFRNLIPKEDSDLEVDAVSINNSKVSDFAIPETAGMASDSSVISAADFESFQSDISLKARIKSKDVTDSYKDIPLEFTKEFDELLCNLPEIIEGERKVEVSEVQRTNERTPEKQKIKPVPLTVKRTKVGHVRKNLNFQKGYKLHEVYKKLTKMEPTECHRAEADVNMLISCAVTLGNVFVDWANINAKKFCDIPVMSALKKIGT